MSFLYWLALVVGGGLFLISLLGTFAGAEGHDGEAFHSDTDTDWGRIFSLRNATYFMFAFGAVGVLLQALWRGERGTFTLLLAVVTGLIAWTLSNLVFTYIRRTDTGHMHGDELLVGRVARVSLPILKGGTGKILVEKAGRTQELLAKPHGDDEGDPETWDSVVVVEVRDGVALVTPFTEAQYDPTKE